jgi:hypothetical protein
LLRTDIATHAGASRKLKQVFTLARSLLCTSGVVA